MSTIQDCWSGNKAEAIEWMKSLKPSDELLYAEPKQQLHFLDATGKGLQRVRVKSVHDDHLIVAYPEINSDQWDRRIPFKYANAARPIDSVANKHGHEADNLSKSSGDSNSSVVAPENCVPFPQQQSPQTENIKHKANKGAFTFNKQARKRRLHPGRNSNTLLTDSPPPTTTTTTTSSTSKKLALPSAGSTLYNQLHAVRAKCSNNESVKESYVESNGSKNERNRLLKQRSTKSNCGQIKQRKLCGKRRSDEHQKREQEQKACKKYTSRRIRRKKTPKSENEDDDEDYDVTADEHGNRGYDVLDDNEQQRCKQVNDNITPSWITSGSELLSPVGLTNMGNTCFMNSTLQSLIHCRKLCDFFLNNEKNHWFDKQLNRNNPIGYGGKIATCFAKLIYECCNARTSTYSNSILPRMVHYNLSGVLRQFADYRQHDAQEFLTNFLDALHEDLNRIPKKKYIQIPDFDQFAKSRERQREFLRTRWHEIYLRRNNSICTDLFAGLLKSTVTCPICKYTAITFHPFMHLLLPLKAPQSMLRALLSNRYPSQSNYTLHHDRYSQPQLKLQRFADSDDEGVDITQSEMNGNSLQQHTETVDEFNCRQIQFQYLPKDPRSSPTSLSVHVSQKIIDKNDWIQLHALLYDSVLKECVEEKEADQQEKTQRDAIRTLMISHCEFGEEEHVLYYGRKHAQSVKRFNADSNICKFPKDFDDSDFDLVDMPLFQLFELYQDDKILHLAKICKKNYNEQISGYVAGSGIKRLMVQQLPSHWTDPKKKSMENESEQKVNCYIVFKKPLPETEIYCRNNDGCEDVDVLSQNKTTNHRSTPSLNGEDLYESFNFPRIVFNKGLTQQMNDDQAARLLHQYSRQVVRSIAGNAISDDQMQKEMEIRYCRNAEKFDLDKIKKWPKVMNITIIGGNNNNSKPKPIQTMVVIFSFAMHQKYTAYQREIEEKKEEKQAQQIQRQQKYVEKKKRENKKRLFGQYQAMNGGNSSNENGYRNQHSDDEVNGKIPRKRQRTHSQSGLEHNRDNSVQHLNHMQHTADDHDTCRDTSLPPEFQPTESKARTIKECFGMFLSREKLKNDNKWYCKKCRDHVNGKKKLDLWWLPSHLIIAIKRFDNHGRRKYTDFVDFPVSGLDLSEIIRGRDSLDIYYQGKKMEDIKEDYPQKEFLYDLYAVINHSGTLNFGHYTSNIQFDGKWYDISDSSVSRCAQRDVVTSQAYILCYKQRE